MSFFDDNKKVGLALMIVGALELILGIVDIMDTAMSDEGLKAAIAIGAVGSMIAGMLWLGYGSKVRGGINDKVAIIVGMFETVAVIFFIIGLFTGIGKAVDNDIVQGVIEIIVGIVVAFILFWVAHKISGEEKNTVSKILWFLIVIVAFIMILVTLVNTITYAMDAELVNAIMELCMIFVYAFVFLGVLSPEIKAKMGM
jgi:hypothetical protein